MLCLTLSLFLYVFFLFALLYTLCYCSFHFAVRECSELKFGIKMMQPDVFTDESKNVMENNA